MPIPYRFKKLVFFVLADAVIVMATLSFAFLLRFDGSIPPEYHDRFPLFLLFAIITVLPIFSIRGIYNFTWRFVSFFEIVEIGKSLAISGVIFSTSILLFWDTWLFADFPRSVIIIHYALALIGIGALRSAKRIVLATVKPFLIKEEAKRVLLIGADIVADQIIRHMRQTTTNLDIVAILDDDPKKQKNTLQGIPVLGRIDDLAELAMRFAIKGIIIALDSAKRENIHTIIDLARSVDIHDIEIIPGALEIQSGMEKNALRPVSVEDLLGREPARIDTEAIEKCLSGKDILITGAAGSIGSELAHHVARFFPKSLMVLDYEESNLFDLMQKLTRAFPDLSIRPVIADIRHEEKIHKLISTLRPQVIFHAAAYKHVPLMELFPDEAVKTNVFGTLALAEAAIAARVEKFVLISTDKAVRPSSIMGQTKRIAEMIIQDCNGRGQTQFLAVQFGNVLESRGSVVPLFKEQIKRGGPVTVTSPAMTRFFMTLSEAVLLVMEAAAIGQGGEIFVLNMGEPVKIVDLAHTLIRLSGLEPEKDIAIAFTGARPGEKIQEELLIAQDNVLSTGYQKIFRIKTNESIATATLQKRLQSLKANLHNPEKLKTEMGSLIAASPRSVEEPVLPLSFFPPASHKPLSARKKDDHPKEVLSDIVQ